MSRRRSILLVVPLLVVAAACQTVVTPDRVPEGGGQTVTVSATGATVVVGGEEPTGFPVPNTCPPLSSVDVFVDGVLVTGATDDVASGDGSFEIDIEAPSEPGSYAVHAVCTLEANVTELEPVNLIVEPDMEMSASPAELDPEQEFEVTGTWCVSQSEDSELPSAEVTFEGVTVPIEASSEQPFGETWSATFTAPADPGTYEVTATCTYDEVDPGFGIIEIDNPVGPPVDLQAVAADVAPAAVEETYATIEVEVVAADQPVTPVDPVDAVDPADAPAPTGAVQPAVVEPTFTG